VKDTIIQHSSSLGAVKWVLYPLPSHSFYFPLPSTPRGSASDTSPPQSPSPAPCPWSISPSASTTGSPASAPCIYRIGSRRTRSYASSAWSTDAAFTTSLASASPIDPSFLAGSVIYVHGQKIDEFTIRILLIYASVQS
jgi:hypothetical protein